MNRESEPPSSNPRPRSAEQWGKIAFYVALLLVVVWLYFTSSGEATSSKPVPANKPPTSATSADSGRQRQAADENRSQPREPRRTPDATSSNKSKRPPADTAKHDERRDSALIVRDVRVTNEDDKIIYRGDIDLRPTLERIERGVRLRFSHDGIVFENRERRLPNKPKGYYHEFIHPTAGENGPGGQRIVRGREGEVYYSPDHYRTFRRVE